MVNGVLKIVKVLDLYAGIGGSATGFTKVFPDCKIIAVEQDAEYAEVYQQRFPNAEVIVDDAMYNLDLIDDVDFAWASPPCQTHTHMNLTFRKKIGLRLIDPQLMQTTIYWKYRFAKARRLDETDVPWAVENVRPYYHDDIAPPAAKVGRHYIWSNRRVPNLTLTGYSPVTASLSIIGVNGKLVKRWQTDKKLARKFRQNWAKRAGLDLSLFDQMTRNKLDKAINNMTDPRVSGHVIKHALRPQVRRMRRI